MEFLKNLAAKGQLIYAKLNIPQRIYVGAFLYLLLMLIFGDVGESVNTVGVLAFIALALETWPLIVKIWSSLLGRILLILFYIIVTNLAVATGAQMLNKIVGIDPAFLFYSKGFVTLLIAPLWILSLTLLIMLVYFVFLQLALMFKLALRLLRFKFHLANQKLAYPTRTAVLKMFLIPFMFATSVSLIERYGKWFGEVDFQVVSVSDDSTDGNMAKDANDTEATDFPDHGFSTQRLIAEFVYHFEAFEYSECQKDEDQRALFVGEQQVLLIRKNSQKRSGHEFVVMPCVLTSAVHTSPFDKQ
ncbi:hypothetical protein QTP81_02125 [Alteromonas sp. ASW11-36]|uniref:Uncharacterized protein n=1 Tax=Alteromonas arenosi TaxID=3055817 RepID=A0ABT7STB2_9ALTE|nr:hypothetical protein [Alteromonas sp. ASW11-36]MDM7859401.1 hypothetical protein [Alteromonas sp. ASW11-36]